jgi:hypothetical protein
MKLSWRSGESWRAIGGRAFKSGEEERVPHLKETAYGIGRTSQYGSARRTG